MLKRDYEGQNCSIASALEIVGERWTLLIIRDAFFGLRRFEQFQEWGDRHLSEKPPRLLRRKADRKAVVAALVPKGAGVVRPDEELRAAGLSANKLASLRDLSAKILDGSVDLNRSSRLSDDDLIAALVTVRGIGRWTAEMYLMFELRRPDVWPVDDLGVRQGYGSAWRLDSPPSARELAPLGDRFHPYRSIAARYCWEAVALYRGGTDP